MWRATQGLALLLPVPALLGGLAVWLRVDQYGWTPERIFAAAMAAMVLGYGLFYAVSVLRGPGWMARIRQANVVMALALLVLAALWLTPVLNAERIAARDQVARYAAGRTPITALDLAALSAWGRAGAAARAELAILAEAPGQQALAQALTGAALPEVLPNDPAAVRAALAEALPLRPVEATASRDRMLATLSIEEVGDWLEMCRAAMPGGGAGCVMVVADFWVDLPGDEAIVLLREPGSYMRMEGFVTQDGQIQRRSIGTLHGLPPDLATGEAMIARLQASALAEMQPAPLNQMLIEGKGLLILP
jgi:hypothetical protein